MSKHQTLKNAIEAFQPGGADVPILYATTEVNEKGFRALLGRKLKSQFISAAVWVWIVVIMAAASVLTVAFGQTGAPSFAAFLPMLIIIFFMRTTLISVSDQGLDFYFAEAKRGSKYVVYDKMSLPYDRIINMKVKTGRFNTGFTFTVSDGDKSYKIKTSVPNKDKKMNEQAENLKHLLEVLEKRLNSNQTEAKPGIS